MPQPYSHDIPANHNDYTENLVADHVNTIARHVNQLEVDANAGGTLDLPGHKASADHDARYMRPGVTAAGGALAGTYPNPTLAAGAATGAVLGSDVVTTGAAQAKSGTLTAPFVDKGGRVFDVRAYGAVSNGSHQQVPFQAAVDAAVAAGNGTVYVPAGSFNFDGTLFLGNVSGSYSGISLIGDSRQSTILSWSGATNGVLLQADGLKNCSISNLQLQNFVGRIADTQTVTVSGNPTGTFLLSYAGRASQPISPTATAAAVQTVLQAMRGYGNPLDVLCSGGPLGTAPVTITLTGQNIGNATSLYTVDTTGLTGGSVVVARGTVGSTMVGLYLTRHTGAGTQIGSLDFRNLGANGFDIGVLGGNGSIATSELNFDHLSLKNCGIGAEFYNFNTLDIHFTMLEMGSNYIGLHMGFGTGNFSVMNGSSSNTLGSDFVVSGSSGVMSIHNYRTEAEKRFLTLFGAGTTGAIVSGCLLTQSSDGPNASLIYADGGRLTVINSFVMGQICGRSNLAQLSVSMIDTVVSDTVPFRVSTGALDNAADTLQWSTFSILGSSSALNVGAGRAGQRFPDQVSTVLAGSNVILPLWSASTQSAGSLPNLYLGGSAAGGWSAAPLYGGLHVAVIPNPSGTLSAAQFGGTGATTYSYYIVAIDANGHKTLAGPVNTITNGLPFGSLDAAHPINLQWPAPGSFSAVAFDVIRSVGGTTQGAIALNWPSLSIQDTGLPATAYTNPTRNATADLRVDGWIGINGIAPAAPPALPIAAVDAATTQALVNAIRSALIGSGITT